MATIVTQILAIVAQVLPVVMAATVKKAAPVPLKHVWVQHVCSACGCDLSNPADSRWKFACTGHK